MFFATEVSRQGKPRNTLKTRFLKKILSVFRDWKDLLTKESQAEPQKSLCPLVNKSPKSTRELATLASDLSDLRLSRQNRATQFLKFSIFVKTKYFPKTTKTLKNLFMFESTKIEHVKTHFIKYNHTNEYDIH